MTSKKIVSILLIIFLFCLLLLFIRSPYWTALTKSKDHFIEHPDNTIVLYEPGAKKNADKILSQLSDAIKTIEEKQLNPFKETFKVYVCNTQQSLNEYGAAKSVYPIRGTALRGDIYIAPSAFHFQGKDTHKETLIHELSHLHFRQRLGFLKDRKIPQWFREGFADYVADSGGEGIEENQAIKFILEGRHFIPEEGGGIFDSFNKQLNGLSGPMFHRQVKMFVAYLAESDTLQFNSLVSKILDGKPFNNSFTETMDMNINSRWKSFIAQLDTVSIRIDH